MRTDHTPQPLLTPHTVSVNNTELTVWIAGTGPAILLVHGFPDTHHIWRKQIPALVDAGYQVLVPDTRGCGDSRLERDVSSYQVDNLVRDMLGVLDHFNIARCALVAHDWGAVCAWRMVIQAPERFFKFAALSVGHPAAYANGGFMQKLRGYYIWSIQLRGAMEWMTKACNWWLFKMLTHCKEEQAQWIKTLSRPGRLTAGFNYYRANLSMVWSGPTTPVSVPVLGIWSAKDRYLVEQQMTRSAQYAEHFTYKRVDNAHHWLQVDQPELINASLLDFFRTE